MIFTLEQVGNLANGFTFEKNGDAPASPDDPNLGIGAIAQHPKITSSRIVRTAVVGYADLDETDPAALSERRAKRIMEMLIARGIAAERLEAHGLGVAPSSAAPQLHHNRVVLFETLYEYRGPLKRWADGGFVLCEQRSHEPGCRPPPSFVPLCTD
jgi:hypothetical protein